MSTQQIAQPTCGATVEGPRVKDRGRSRPLWRRQCRRRVKSWGDRCYQHATSSSSAHPIKETKQ